MSYRRHMGLQLSQLGIILFQKSAEKRMHFGLAQPMRGLLTRGDQMEKSNRNRICETGLILSFKSGVSRFGSTKGQSTVEFAMIASLFLLLLLAVVDYGWLMFAEL